MPSGSIWEFSNFWLAFSWRPTAGRILTHSDAYSVSGCWGFRFSSSPRWRRNCWWYKITSSEFDYLERKKICNVGRPKVAAGKNNNESHWREKFKINTTIKCRVCLPCCHSIPIIEIMWKECKLIAIKLTRRRMHENPPFGCRSK